MVNHADYGQEMHPPQPYDSSAEWRQGHKDMLVADKGVEGCLCLLEEYALCLCLSFAALCP